MLQGFDTADVLGVGTGGASDEFGDALDISQVPFFPAFAIWVVNSGSGSGHQGSPSCKASPESTGTAAGVRVTFDHVWETAFAEAVSAVVPPLHGHASPQYACRRCEG